MIDDWPLNGECGDVLKPLGAMKAQGAERERKKRYALCAMRLT